MRAFPAALALASMAVATRANAGRFEEKTERLGSPQPCFDPANPDAEGCYSHDVVMVDLNGDHALDIVFANGGGYFVATTAAPLAIYSNDGAGNLRESGGTLVGGFQGRVRQVAVGDVDGDGDLDLYVPDSYGLQPDAFFIDEGGTFVDEGAARLPVSSRAGAARFGDADGDGDLDLFLADWGDHPPHSRGTARVYVNDGKGYFREKVGAVPQDTDAIGTGPVDLDLFDADGDFDLDILIANRAGNSLLFLGDGAGTFTNAPSFPHQNGPYVYGPDECDVDGDGDLDVWLDNGGTNDTEQLLINDGRGNFADETSARVTGNPPFSDDNVVRCADVNGDGALDAVIGSVGKDRRVLINDGAGRFAFEPDAFPAQTISTLGLDLGDVDGDGRIDAVTAQGESGPFLNRLYLGTAAVPADVHPPVVRAVEALADATPTGTAVVRFAVRDGATTELGPRLRSATLETADARVVPAVFVGGDLFRAVLPVPAARVTYRACAVDWAGNRGCSDPVTFVPKGDPSGAPASRGCGCAVHGTPPRALAASLFAACSALVLRRATRRSRRG